MKKKTIALVLAMFLLIGGTLGVTLAYLQDTTQVVTNTFTVGDIDIKLDETQVGEDGKPVTTGTRVESQDNPYKVVPGTNISKDPLITFTKDSEPCWLFVKVEESANWTTTKMTYSVDTSIWTLVPGQTNVWFKKLDTAPKANDNYQILTGNLITVPATIGNTELEAAKTANLKFTAYAIQLENLADAAAAWAALNPTNP